MVLGGSGALKIGFNAWFFFSGISPNPLLGLYILPSVGVVTMYGIAPFYPVYPFFHLFLSHLTGVLFLINVLLWLLAKSGLLTHHAGWLSKSFKVTSL